MGSRVSFGMPRGELAGIRGGGRGENGGGEGREGGGGGGSMLEREVMHGLLMEESGKNKMCGEGNRLF